MKKDGSCVFKRGQVTIFIILAIVIAVGIIAVSMLVVKPKVLISPTENPSGYIENCMKDNIELVLPGILVHGGQVKPSNKTDESVLYEDKQVAYLCYAEGKLKICEQNTPLLKKQIEEEIERSTKRKIEECFSNLKLNLKGYDIKESETNYSVFIDPTSLRAVINKKLIISRGENSQEFSRFVYERSSPVYDFIILTNKILNTEVSCECGREACRADVLQLSKDNMDFEIKLFVGNGDIEVYEIKDLLSGLEFKFAVRNCIE
jgi:hypothetical protein